MRKIYVALEDIRSLHNVGAALRTCSFFGVTEVLLVGYSGKTKDHYDKVILHPEIEKTALGSEKDLKIKFIESTAALLSFTTKHSLKVVAIEQSKSSISLHDWNPPEDESVVLVFGNEVTGVSSAVMAVADTVVEIPKKGTHSSLNVTTTCGVVLYALTF